MALAMQAEGASKRLRAELSGIFGLTRAYRRLFFDRDGKMTPDARMVLRDLVRESDLARAARDLDPGALALLEGKRWMVLHVFGRFRLPEGRIDQLERDLKSAEDDHA